MGGHQANQTIQPSLPQSTLLDPGAHLAIGRPRDLALSGMLILTTVPMEQVLSGPCLYEPGVLGYSRMVKKKLITFRLSLLPSSVS